MCISFVYNPQIICHYFYNSSNSFMPIYSKLYMSLGHCLKMCLPFGYNPLIILSLFSQVELSHLSGLIIFKVNS